MALHDVDQSSADRSSPKPNSPDSIIDGAVKAHKTVSTHYSTDADSSVGRLQMENKQIIGNDGTTNKALLGYQQGLGKWGFFVAKDGIDVTTNTDTSQFIFNSNQDVFKIVSSGTAAQTVASLAQDVTTTLTVAHNLGYIPAALVYLNGTGSTYLTANRYYVPPVTVPVKIGVTYYPGIIHTFSIDSTNIYFMVTNSSAATPITDIGTVNWKYYLLQETAT